MPFVEFLYALSGISLCPFWNFSMSFLEFLYALSGISLCPLWNFSMSFLEFLYVLSGISLCPFPHANGLNSTFFPRLNQVIIKY